MRGVMQGLGLAAALVIALALAVIAAAVYRTWNEMHMTIVTVAGSLCALSVPVIAGVATFLAVREKTDATRAARLQAESAEREKQMLAMLDMQRRIAVVTLQEQRGQSEAYRTERNRLLLAGMQAPQLEAPGNPWATDEWDDDDAAFTPIVL